MSEGIKGNLPQGRMRRVWSANTESKKLWHYSKALTKQKLGGGWYVRFHVGVSRCRTLSLTALRQTSVWTCKTCSTALTLVPDTVMKSPKPKRLSSRDRPLDERKDTVSSAVISKGVNALSNRYSALEKKISMNTKAITNIQYVKSWKEGRSK